MTTHRRGTGRHRTRRAPRTRPRIVAATVLGAALLIGGGVAAADSSSSRTAAPASSSAPSTSTPSTSTPSTTSSSNGSSNSSRSRTVKVTLAEKNDSGVSGRATVNGSKVTATATGLDPDRSYYSFVYGNGSTSGGSNPCILTGERGAGAVNTVGEWDVDEDGTGTLSGTITLPELEPGTISIREDDLGASGAAGPTPADSLVACGQIGPRATTPAGQVQDRLPKIKVPDTDTLTTTTATP